MRLWEIDDELRRLEDTLEGMDENDAALHELTALLDSAQDRLESKIEGILWLIREREAFAKLRLEEATRLRSLATSDSNRAEGLRKFLLNYLQSRGRDKIETDRFSVSVSRNSVAPLLLETDADSLPDEFVRTQRSPDLTAIRKAIEQGGTVPGATFGERSFHLRIR